MIFDRDELKEQIKELTHHQQVFFALLCAERLRACCWAFSQREKWDLSIYYEACDLLFQHLTCHTPLDKSQVENTISTIDERVPQSDEFGDPLSVQAQSGLIALLYTFDAWKMIDPEAVTSAAIAVGDALDNYEYFVNETLTGNTTSPEEYALLDREIQWEFDSIKLLKHLTDSEAERFLSLRVLNMSYAVPIAV